MPSWLPVLLQQAVAVARGVQHPTRFRFLLPEDVLGRRREGVRLGVADGGLGRYRVTAWRKRLAGGVPMLSLVLVFVSQHLGQTNMHSHKRRISQVGESKRQMNMEFIAHGAPSGVSCGSCPR